VILLAAAFVLVAVTDSGVVELDVAAGCVALAVLLFVAAVRRRRPERSDHRA
jgi:hypothetical protein